MEIIKLIIGKIIRKIKSIIKKLIKNIKKRLNKVKKIGKLFIITIKALINRIFWKTKRKNQDINILFIIGSISNGGAERACVNLAEELSKKYKVTIVIFYEKNNRYKCNVPIIKLDNEKYSNLERIVEISKIKKDKKITHTISLLIGPNYVNVMSKKNDKVIISVRNYITEAHKNRINDLRQHRIACKLADKIVCVSKSVEKDQIDNWKIKKSKSVTIDNFVNDQKIINSIETGKIDKEDEKIFANPNIVINVGRLVEQKGQDHLIRAFKYVVKEVPDAQLVILGDGELREHFSKLIKELDLCNNVYLIGFKKNPYIYMSKSKIFVLSSYFEGMSNAMLEAMNCGLPVIATDCNGGNRDILSDGNKDYGILVPVLKNDEDEKKLAIEIVKLLKNEELRQEYVNKSKERIKNYSKEKIVKQWEALLKD